MSYSRQAAKSAGILVIVALASKILGFVREQAIAYSFGASYLTDAYYVASIIPLMLFASVNGALRHTLIPIFVEYLEQRGKAEAFRFANNVFNILLIVLFLIVIGGYFLAPWLIKIIAPGFEGRVYLVAVEQVKILLVVIIFLGIAGVASGILNSFKDFTIPALVGLPQNIIIILAVLLLGQTMGIYGLALGTVLGVASQMFLQLPFLKKRGMTWQPLFELDHPGVKKMGLLVIPIFLGASVNQVNVIIDRILASGLPEGSISALNFANKMSGLPLGLFTAAIATVLFPTLAEYAVKKDLNKFKESFYNGVKVILFLTLPISVGLVILREPLIQLLFQRGAFNHEDTLATAFALQFYALGMVAISLREFMNKVYFSLQDTTLPMITGAIGLGVNIILNLLLVRYLAHGGLALATSVSALINVMIMFVFLPRKIGNLKYSQLGLYLFKISLAAIMMGGIVYLGDFLYPTMPEAALGFRILKIGLLIILGAAVYFVVSYFLRVEELHWLQRKVADKIYRKLKFRVNFFPINQKVPHINIRLPLSIVEVDDTTLQLPNFRSPKVVAQFKEMLASGQRGFFVIYQEQVVHHAWALINETNKPLPLKHLEIPAQSAYIHYCSTREDLRGQGIFPWVLTKILLELQKDYRHKLKGVYIDADALNHASLRAQEKAHFKPYAQVMDYVFLGYHRRIIKLLDGEENNG